MARIVVIGAGPMGLAAAHRGVSLGHEVDLIEADRQPGGMAAHFDFGGLSIERFYHFVCKSDAPIGEKRMGPLIFRRSLMMVIEHIGDADRKCISITP